MSGYIGDCIKFYDDTETRLYTQGRHIKIVDDSGCWSYVGSVFEGEQLLSLKQPGCVWKKTVQHELTHALGFLHEQSRPDRDLYIEVHEDRIKTDMAHNYDKMPTTNWNDLGGIYDWKPNMHYEYWYYWTDAAAAFPFSSLKGSTHFTQIRCFLGSRMYQRFTVLPLSFLTFFLAQIK